MATTYAMPPAPGRGGHGHSHSRKTATQRMPLQPTTMNGGYQQNVSSVHMNSFKPYDIPPRDAPKAAEAFPDLQPQQNQPSTLQLPKPPSFSSPNSSRSKSMERRKSVGLPTHLNLQANGYGFHTAGVQKFEAKGMETRRPWMTKREMISAILIPLPCTLASLVFEMGIQPRPSGTHDLPNLPLGPLPEADGEIASFQAARSSFSLVCGLTAMALAAVGLSGKAAQAFAINESGGTSGFVAGLKRSNFMQLGRRVAGRIVTIGLPFYAIAQLGGLRVAVVLLLALASNLMTAEEQRLELSTWKGWKQLIIHRRWTMLSLLFQATSDLTGTTSRMSVLDIGLGYLALGLVVFVLPPPYPSLRPTASILCSSKPATEASTWVNSSEKEIQPLSSPFIYTPEDTDLTLVAAILVGAFSYLLPFITGSSTGAASLYQISWIVLTALTASLALMFTDTKAFSSNRGFGSLLGSFASCIIIMTIHQDTWFSFLYQIILISMSSTAMFIDSRKLASVKSHSAHHHHHHHQHGMSHAGEIAGASKFTNYVLGLVQEWPLLHTILVEKDSRRIFYFMCLNFAFMLVQTFYGIVSGSLGLLSDSIHMFFDCLALLVGLSAAVMSKWPPSTKFPYGYAKIETLAGFANGVFLMLISIEIIYEALERLSVGSNVKRLNELMTVSILGFLINVIGILAFGHAHHGHDHSHGHSHNHDDHDHADHLHKDHEYTHDHSHTAHSHHEHDHHHEHAHETHHQDHVHHENLKPKPYPSIPNGHTHQLPENLQIPTPSPSIYSSVPATPSKPPSHSHSHNHGSHSHDHHHSENMMGIYLHVLGDTLGSAAVVLSTWLVQLNGWSGWDPLASTGIAIIIFGTAIPLVKNCARKLLLTVPEDTEYDLREALASISGLRGVVGCAVPKFWIQEGDQRRVMGVVHVMADRVSNLEDVKERCIAYLKGAGLDVLVQVERDGVGRCWCQATR